MQVSVYLCLITESHISTCSPQVVCAFLQTPSTSTVSFSYRKKDSFNYIKKSLNEMTPTQYLQTGLGSESHPSMWAHLAWVQTRFGPGPVCSTVPSGCSLGPGCLSYAYGWCQKQDYSVCESSHLIITADVPWGMTEIRDTAMHMWLGAGIWGEFELEIGWDGDGDGDGDCWPEWCCFRVFTSKRLTHRAQGQ